MCSILVVYLTVQVVLFISAIMIWALFGGDPAEGLTPPKKDPMDRLWWKYSKHVLWWGIFGVTRIPWAIPWHNIFKKGS